MIRLVCLDMAGTTVLDDGAVMAAFTAALGELGLEPGTAPFQDAQDHALATMGQSKIEVFRAITGPVLGRQAPDEDAAHRANEAFERAYQDGISAPSGGGVAAIPGAAEAIRELRVGGTKVALTTGFSPMTRDAILAALGWDELADLVLSPADAGRGRPWPDMVLTAVLRLGVDDVREVAVAGDTTSDLVAGTRAGASVVAGVLTGAHPREQLASAPHTHLLDSVADLPSVVGVQSTSAA